MENVENSISIQDLRIDVSGGINLYDFKKFLVNCNKLGISDITLQGGDYIYVNKNNENFRASISKVKNQALSPLLANAFGTEVEPLAMQGKPVNKALEIVGTEYGLLKNEKIRFRCNMIQCTVGNVNKTISITMRVIPSKIKSLEELNVSEEIQQAFNIDMGLILICGPTASGKTSLRASWFEHKIQTNPHVKIITYESPIEYLLGLSSRTVAPIPAQSEFGRDYRTWDEAISAALRRNPKILDIGEASSPQTITALIEASETGILTFSTTHTASASDTISRLINIFPVSEQTAIAFKLLYSLKVILVQRLIKKIGGGVVPIQELFIIDDEIKNNLEVLEPKFWAREIRLKQAQNKKDLPSVAFNLYQKKIITEETYIHTFGYNTFLNKQKKY